mmetsp:Transcript_8298/g.7348  ORF Transcript_8298/g.7348 Transcript_8298/m.7348 type:complete len:132 (+) Transcript_8298:154-549(+)
MIHTISDFDESGNSENNMKDLRRDNNSIEKSRKRIEESKERERDRGAEIRESYAKIIKMIEARKESEIKSQMQSHSNLKGSLSKKFKESETSREQFSDMIKSQADPKSDKSVKSEKSEISLKSLKSLNKFE